MTRRRYLTTLELQRLDHAAVIVEEAFGSPPYLVGSAETTRDFRDVDVRTILADEDFDALFKGRERLWSLFCTAVSLYLSDVSGLPVDYQVQRRTQASEKYGHLSRNPLGLRPRRLFAGGGDATH